MPSSPSPRPPPTPCFSQCGGLSTAPISTVTLMREIAYEGNLFLMVGQMINVHWQRVSPSGALLGRSSCVTPPPPRCPPPPRPTLSWHPTGGGKKRRCCRGSVTSITRQLGPEYHHETALTFAFLLDVRQAEKRLPKTLEVSKLAKTSRQKCLEKNRIYKFELKVKCGGESVSNHRNWGWIWWLQVASIHSCSAVSISSWM